MGVKPEKKDAKEKEEEEEPKDAKADSAAREAERRPEYLPGTAFWAGLDPRHFLGYGYDAPRIPVLLQGRLFLKPSREGSNVATFDREPLKLTGWSWPETERRLKGTAYAIDVDELARDLGFSRIVANSIDASSDRDFAATFLYALASQHIRAPARERSLRT